MTESVPTDPVLIEVVDGVAIVSFNRPERHNAINNEMSRMWRDAMMWAIESADVRCILIRGEGPSFSSGRDTAELGRRSSGQTDHSFVKKAQDLRIATLEAAKPIVAAVHGHTIGGACEIALSADIRIAADDLRMATPEVRYGLVADTGATQLITMLAGPARAKWMLMSGERIDATTALDWGLVDWVVDPDDLRGVAMEKCRLLAAAPSHAVRTAKSLVDGVWLDTVRRGMRAELEAQTALFAGDEYRELKARRAAKADDT
jgi:enoyl-CoA hydratase/carnithine racemase